jgi:ATP/maltotriose-dependent transcriptional regulator MalT
MSHQLEIESQEFLSARQEAQIPFTLNGEKRYLTTREFQILYLISQGITGPELRAQLVKPNGKKIAPRTLRNHFSNLYDKLGIQGEGSQIRAILVGLAVGLIEIEPLEYI